MFRFARVSSLRQSESLQYKQRLASFSRHLTNCGHGVIIQTFSDQNVRETLKKLFSHILSYVKELLREQFAKWLLFVPWI